LGLAIILVCVVVQHVLARKQEPVSLNMAFFRMNAVISAVFLLAVVADVVSR
jgi:4-hydroxybenzoate polyprenyltransferase